MNTVNEPGRSKRPMTTDPMESAPVSSTTLERLAIIAASALVISGTVHLMEAPGTMGDATYLGLSFYAHFFVTLAAAIGILMGSRMAWGLGAFVSAASIGMYVISRTVGLPGQSGEQWTEWSGVIAVAAEAVALVATLAGLRVVRTVRSTRLVATA